MSSYKQLQIKLSKQLNGDFFGNFISAFKGHGMEFADLREYFPGDSIKKIDWKTTAKQNKVFVKNYEEARDINALFHFDISPSLSFGSRKKTKLDTMQEVFYILASAATENGFRIGTSFGEKYLEFASGEKNIIRTLKYLDNKSILTSSPEGRSPLLPHIKKLKNSLIFIFSDKMNDYDIKALATYNDIVYINIYDSLETSGTPDSFRTSISGISSFFSKNKQDIYKQARAKSIQKFQNALQKKSVRYLAIDDTDNIFLCFYKFFTKTT